MFLRVYFGDNDFGNAVRLVCETFLEELTGGLKGDEALTYYGEIRKGTDLEMFRQAFVQGIVGAIYILDAARNIVLGNPTPPGKDDHYTKYFTRKICVEEIQKVPHVWENLEVAYIDLALGKIYIQ